MEERITSKIVNDFLFGYDPMERIITIECDYTDDEVSIIYVDELIDACDSYCKNWSTIDELEFKNFTSQHMLWFCLTYVRYHDENYKMEFDDWDRAIDLEEELENL